MSGQSLYIKSKYYSLTRRYISINYKTYLPEIWNSDPSNTLNTMCNKKGLFRVHILNRCDRTAGILRFTVGIEFFHIVFINGRHWLLEQIRYDHLIMHRSAHMTSNKYTIIYIIILKTTNVAYMFENYLIEFDRNLTDSSFFFAKKVYRI